LTPAATERSSLQEIRLRIIVTGVRGRKAGHRPAGPGTAEPWGWQITSDINVATNCDINKFV